MGTTKTPVVYKNNLESKGTRNDHSRLLKSQCEASAELTKDNLSAHDETLKDFIKPNILSEGEGESKHLMKIEQIDSYQLQAQRIPPDSADTSFLQGNGRVRVIGTKDFINSTNGRIVSPQDVIVDSKERARD